MNKPICEINNRGNKFWRSNGEYHRVEGPAIEYVNGDKFWYLNGELHREDGPAIDYIDSYKSWYLWGVKYTKEEYRREMLIIKLSGLK